MEPVPNISEPLTSPQPQPAVAGQKATLAMPMKISQRWWNWLKSLWDGVNPLVSPQAANTLYAGPTSGATAVVPTFRTMVAADGPPTAFSGTITTAKLTGTGVNGSMTFTNGILVSQVQAT